MFKCSEILLILSIKIFFVFCDDNGELFYWNVMNFQSPPREETYQISSKNYYIPENNIPTGITPYKDKLFVTIARTNFGIPSTLNYIDLRESRDLKSPLLHSYPDYNTNELYPDLREDKNRLVSVYRSRIDDCDRLWFVDTGIIENEPITKIQKPSIWVIDLKTDKVIRRFEITDDVISANMSCGFVSINVDSDKRRCDDAFAYIPNSKANKIFVYSMKEDRMWEFSDPSMKPDETKAILQINGNNFTQNNGIYSIVLGKRNRDRYRKIHYHSLASTSEYSILTTILKVSQLPSTTSTSTEFKFVGNRGDQSQSGMHDIDLRNGVIFFTQLQKNSIVCWNAEKPLKAENIAIVAKNDTSLIYPSDIKMDNIGRLWYLSNKMPLIKSPNKLNKEELNFFIFRKSAYRLIDNTACKLLNLFDLFKSSNVENEDYDEVVKDLKTVNIEIDLNLEKTTSNKKKSQNDMNAVDEKKTVQLEKNNKIFNELKELNLENQLTKESTDIIKEVKAVEVVYDDNKSKLVKKNNIPEQQTLLIMENQPALPAFKTKNENVEEEIKESNVEENITISNDFKDLNKEKNSNLDDFKITNGEAIEKL